MKLFELWEENDSLSKKVLKIKENNKIVFVSYERYGILNENKKNDCEIIAEFDRKQFDEIDLESITEDECYAIGEFLNGAIIIPEFFSELLIELAQCKQQVNRALNLFNNELKQKFFAITDLDHED